MRTNTVLAFLFSTSTLALAPGCIVGTAAPQPEPAGQPEQTALTSASVDTGVTLTSPPGQGAGVNVEYQPGGHWHVWWTCDTNLSGLSCDFTVDVIARSGAITNVAGDRLESTDSLTQPGANEITLATGTSTGVDGVYFDTDPGAVVEIYQQIGDVQDGTYFYWSEGGQVQGGGTPANVGDPMAFVGSVP